MRAACELQAVRRHDEQTVGRHADMHPMKEQITHGNKGSLELSPLYAEDGAEAHRRRKEQIDEFIGLTLHPRQIRQPRNRQHHIEYTEKREQNRAGKHSTDRPRQERLNAFEPRHADIPYDK